jgi:3-oxoacyl-[acyl-carrier-protein] synthase II
MAGGVKKGSLDAVVITGVGVLSPIGCGRAAFWEGLAKGASGIVPLTLFDTADLHSRMAGVVNYDPAELLGAKGLRYLSRSTKWLQCATAMAIEDAGLEAAADRSGWALVVGTAFGSLQSISEFDHEALRNGPSSVNPMSFPNTVINAPAGQTAIRFGLRGPNTTISAGCVSGLNALGYGAGLIRSGGIEFVLAGGAEELCEASYRGYYQGGQLSGSGGLEQAMPFDRRRNGLILGEGAAILLLEPAAQASRRGARILGEIAGFGETFGPDAGSLAMRIAIEEAGIEPDDVDLICAGASGSKAGDAEEARAIQETFGAHASSLAVHAVKAACGEALGASGALQAAAGLYSFAEQTVPPTLHFDLPDPDCPVEGLHREAIPWKTGLALVTASNREGNHSAVVLKRFTDGKER